MKITAVSTEHTLLVLVQFAAAQNPGGLSLEFGTDSDISPGPADGYLAHSHPGIIVCLLSPHKTALGGTTHCLSSALRVMQRLLLFPLQVSPSAARRQVRCLSTPPPLLPVKIFPGLPTIPPNY